MRAKPTVRKAFTPGRTLRLLLAATLSPAIALIPGCGGGSGGSGSNLRPQTVLFTAPPAQTAGTTLALYPLSSSGLPISLTSSTPTVCTLSGFTATFLIAGTCTITASQPGNSIYAAAAPVTVSFPVNLAPQTITFPTPATQKQGVQLSLSATATSGLAVSYQSTTAPVCTVSGSTATFLTAGTCSITASQPGNATYSAATPVSVTFPVEPAVPILSNFTPRYVAAEPSTHPTQAFYDLQCEGCETNDVLHDVTGIFGDATLPSALTDISYFAFWQMGGGPPGLSTFQPTWDTLDIERPNSPTSNQVSTAFMGLGNQSTLAVSAKTGTLFQIEQKDAHIYTLKADGTTGELFPNLIAVTPVHIAVDDLTGNFAFLFTGFTGQIVIYDEAGNDFCFVDPAVAPVSSVSAKGGYVVFTAPSDNLVGIFKIETNDGVDCIGLHTIPVTGQPWAVTMATNGAELDAYVLSRDKWSANGLPGLTKINVQTGAILGSVELTGTTPVSTIRATNPYAGLYQVQAFNNSPTAAVLFMSDSTNGTVLTVNTDTSGGNTMQITNTVGVPELPFAIAADETVTPSTVWVAYISPDSGEAITHIGAINPATGSFTGDVGACTTGVLAGGFLATSNGVYCAQGNTIQPPLKLQP